MSALRGLQDKIRRLELERSQAEENLMTLAGETARYRKALNQPNLDGDLIIPEEPADTSTIPANISQQAKGLLCFFPNTSAKMLLQIF